MDLYQGQVDPAHQVHDFNPGITPSGLFWVIRIPDESVEVDLNEAEASMDLSDLDMEDYHDIVNAVHDGPSVPANVSYHIRWHGVKDRVHVRDEKNEFVGNFIEDTATIRWSAQTKNFKFVSDPANTSTTVFAEIGHERNGEFFHDDDDDGDTH
jgi:hypothetical protein